MLSAVSPAAVHADKSVADILGKSAALEGEPRSYLEELMLYGYIENSYVANLRDAGRGGVNELRFYDHAGGYTFNAMELSVKKDPAERYRLGYGVVITAGSYSACCPISPFISFDGAFTSPVASVIRK